MKKFLLGLLLFFFGLKLFTPTAVFAQGTHRCTFQGSQVACAPAETTCDTANGYFPNYAYCNRFDPQPSLSGGNPSGCNNAAFVACVNSVGPTQPIDFTGLTGETGLNSSLGNFGDIVSLIVKYAFPIGGLLLLLYLVYGGYALMTSAGDPKKMESAKAKITGALIGFIIIFVSFWIVQIVGRVLNIQPIIDIFG